MQRLEVCFPLVVIAVVGLVACDGSPPPGPADRARALSDVHQLRVLGKLHAERDTPEGWQAARGFLQRVIELESTSPSDHLRLAKVLLYTGELLDCERALAQARRLFHADDLPPDVDYVLALLKKRQSSFQEAHDALLRVVNRRPHQVQAWFQRASVEEALGQREAALNSLEACLRAQPDFSPAVYRLGMNLRLLGKEKEAKIALDRFRMLPDPGGFETEKCELTQVTLRPQNRRAVEPQETSMALENASEKWTGARAGLSGFRRARAFYTGESPLANLLLSGPGGVQVLLPGKSVGTSSPRLSRTAALDAFAVDLKNDGVKDVVLVAANALLFYPFETGHPQAAPQAISGDAGGSIHSAAPHDIDHDGDLDLIELATQEQKLLAAIWRNNADATFTRLDSFGTLEGMLPANTASSSMSAHDLDQANDLDLILAGGTGGVQAFLNRRDGSFHKVTLTALGKRSVVLADDFTNDGAPDIFAAGIDPGWALATNADALGVPQVFNVLSPPSESRVGEVRDACAADVDCDGDLDIILGTASGLDILRNRRGGELAMDAVMKLENSLGATSVSVVDLDGDGALEVLAGTDDDHLRVFTLGPRPPHVAFTLALTGTRDSSDSIGTVVEVFAGRSYQSLIVRETGRLRLGLGAKSLKTLDGLRLRWPQGIVQSVLPGELTIDRQGTAHVRQKEGLAASCPYLYSRSPDGWRFVTDILGIAPLDEWLPPGESPRLDPEEFVRLDGRWVDTSQGVVELAVTEELRETAYLDRLQLIAIEHAEDVEVFTDESSQAPDYGPLRLSIVERRHLSSPASLREANSNDAEAAAANRDGLFLRAFRELRPQWAGWVEPYSIDMVTREPAQALLLTGRVAWYDSTTAFSLWQQGRSWELPRLDLLDTARSQTLGLPAGMDRTMICTLAGGLGIPAGTRVQLSAQHRLLWDQVQFATRVESVNIDTDLARGTFTLHSGQGLEYQELKLLRANLFYRGFSRALGDRARHEQTYDYSDASPSDEFPPTPGRATRHGDVLPLLTDHDDFLAVLVAGDAVEVAFEAPRLAARGRKLTYFLRSSGWAKEASFHNRTGGQIEPLPWRGMKSYPSRREDAVDETYARYLETYQTRIVHRRAP